MTTRNAHEERDAASKPRRHKRYSRSGRSNTPSFTVWRNIVYQCENHPHYLAKGMAVCVAWRDGETGFDKFIEDVGERPGFDYFLHLIDRHSGHQPQNVEWITRDEFRRLYGGYIRKLQRVQAMLSEAQEILDDFNSVAMKRGHKAWRERPIKLTSGRLEMMRARLKSGHTVGDFNTVHRNMACWLDQEDRDGNLSMAKHFRPETLYRSDSLFHRCTDGPGWGSWRTIPICSPGMRSFRDVGENRADGCAKKER